MKFYGNISKRIEEFFTRINIISNSIHSYLTGNPTFIFSKYLIAKRKATLLPEKYDLEISHALDNKDEHLTNIKFSGNNISDISQKGSFEIDNYFSDSLGHIDKQNTPKQTYNISRNINYEVKNRKLEDFLLLKQIDDSQDTGLKSRLNVLIQNDENKSLREISKETIQALKEKISKNTIEIQNNLYPTDINAPTSEQSTLIREGKKKIDNLEGVSTLLTIQPLGDDETVLDLSFQHMSKIELPDKHLPESIPNTYPPLLPPLSKENYVCGGESLNDNILNIYLRNVRGKRNMSSMTTDSFNYNNQGYEVKFMPLLGIGKMENYIDDNNNLCFIFKNQRKGE